MDVRNCLLVHSSLLTSGGDEGASHGGGQRLANLMIGSGFLLISFTKRVSTCSHENWLAPPKQPRYMLPSLRGRAEGMPSRVVTDLRLRRRKCLK